MMSKKHQKILHLVLASALILQCVALLKITYVDGTKIGTTMFMTFQWAEDTMLTIDRGAAWVCLVLSILLLIQPIVWRAETVWKIAGGLIGAWFVLIAVATWYQGGSFGAQYALFAYSARYGLPLLIVALATDQKTAEWMGRILIAVTFFAHGLEAWALHPQFIDYIIVGLDEITGVRINQSQSELILRGIGAMDCIVAILVIAKRWKPVVAWMAFWGAATATSRMIHLGFFKWPATMYRAAHFAIPFALYLWWRFDKVGAQPHEEED